MRPSLIAILFAAAALLLSAAPAVCAEDAQTSLEGFVTGETEDGPVALKGAEVRADSGGAVLQTAYIDSKGYFSIPCDAGTYTVTVKYKGFETVVISNVSAPGIMEANLQPRVSDLAWGLDTPHALEVVAILVLMTILAAGMATYALAKDKNSGIQMVNDLDGPDDLKEDEPEVLDDP